MTDFIKRKFLFKIQNCWIVSTWIIVILAFFGKIPSTIALFYASLAVIMTALYDIRDEIKKLK